MQRSLESIVLNNEERSDRLLLVNVALWELLQEHVGLTEKMLSKKIEEVDMRDGIKDGKISKQIMTCENCTRILSNSHRKCIYCGTDVVSKAHDALV